MNREYLSPRYYFPTMRSFDKFKSKKQHLTQSDKHIYSLKNKDKMVILPNYTSSEKKQYKKASMKQCLRNIQTYKFNNPQSHKTNLKKSIISFSTQSNKNKSGLTQKLSQRQIKNRKLLYQNKFSLETLDISDKFNKGSKICDGKKILKDMKIHPMISTLKNLKQSVSTDCSQKKMKKTLKLQDFDIGKKIGNGKFGKVYRARHKISNTIYALKKILKTNITEQIKNQLMNQIKIQASLDHPNIVKLYAFFNDKQYIYLLMQLCTSGHLYDLNKNIQNSKQQTNKVIIKQICHGIDYLHQNQILHRDLKLQNILYHFGMIKICDFGWSTINQKLRNTFCGTPLYFSPQLLQQKNYSHKVDIWSIGVLAFEIMYGRPPFKITCNSDFSKIVQQQIIFPENTQISQQSKDFLKNCLRKTPQQRMEAIELIQHKYLQNCEAINCSYLY